MGEKRISCVSITLRILFQLYAMGGNSLGQLGVGSHISVSLHPVLVERLMDLPLEMIAVGQYHNAVVARGQVYVWGWGVYGQLGNGGVEDVHVPTVLPFFNGRVSEDNRELFETFLTFVFFLIENQTNRLGTRALAGAL